MFNHSHDSLIFLLDDERLTQAIIDSIGQAKEIMLSMLNRKQISAEEVTSASRNPLNRGTIFKFFESHESNSNLEAYTKAWVNNVFKLSYRADGPYNEMSQVFTTKGRLHKITNVFRGSLKLDAKLIMHLLWCNKAILLPYGYPLPYSHGSKVEYAASSYPELLAIIRKPFLDADRLTGIPYIDLPPDSKNNFSWYFKNFVRAATWWKLEDITTEDISEILGSKLSKSPSRQSQFQMLRTWLGYIENAFPQKTNYDLLATLTTHGSLKEDRQSRASSRKYSSNSEDYSFISAKQRKKLSIWLDYLNLWKDKLSQKKIMTSGKKMEKAAQVVNYLVYEVYAKTELIPEPSEFSRAYIDGIAGQYSGLNDFISIGKSPSTIQGIIYNINQFFVFLELYSRELGGFRNVINLKIDAPYVGRKKGTVKKIFSSEYYPAFISYLYGLADWVWWMMEFCKTQAGKDYVRNVAEDNQNKRFWVTADTGFVPLVWHEGRPVPVHVIPRFIAPLHYRYMANSPGHLSPSVLPNYINIGLILAETGIRSSHIHWLDSRYYDQDVDRKGFNSYSFDIAKLHVNTDKVNGPWSCYTSMSVIGVLDRQKKYQDSILNENVKDLVDYSWNPNNPYEQIECIFALGSIIARRSQSNKEILNGPSRPDSYVSKYKCLLYGFNITLSHVESFEPFMELAQTKSEVNTYEYFRELFPSLPTSELYKTEITPHSARSQIVSNYITLLPPNVIRAITGHATDAHLVYYAQLDNIALDKARKDSRDAMKDSIQFSEKVVSINAEDENSKLRLAFRKNRAAAMLDFGATSFSSLSEAQDSNLEVSGLLEVKRQPADQIVFNSTHICPFNNQCPKEVRKEFKGVDMHKPCGRCFYAVKTIDHLPRIYGKIRVLMDECSELEQYIQSCKDNNVSSETIEEAATKRRLLADDIMGWTISSHCLESMASELSLRDKWLIEKPDLLSQHIERIQTKDGELESLLLRVAEAKHHAEFFTSSLKHQITKARTKLLAHTGQFNKLLQDVPNDFTLLDEFRGQILSICQATNTSIGDLSQLLREPPKSLEASNSPYKLLSLTVGHRDA